MDYTAILIREVVLQAMIDEAIKTGRLIGKQALSCLLSEGQKERGKQARADLRRMLEEGAPIQQGGKLSVRGN